MEEVGMIWGKEQEKIRMDIYRYRQYYHLQKIKRKVKNELWDEIILNAVTWNETEGKVGSAL